MNRRRKKSSRRRGGPKLRSLFIIFALIPLVGGALYLFMQRNAELEATDQVTLCRSDLRPSVTAILIDTSDKLDPVQRERTIAELTTTARNSEEGAQFELYRMEPLGDELAKPVFTICNPGKAGSALVSDVRADERRFQEVFLGALEREIKTAAEGQADTTPLLENIRSVSTRAFARLEPRTDRKLIIVSDMLQHSDLISHYRPYSSYQDFLETRAGVASVIDLERVEVEILYLLRLSERARQNRVHQIWWEDYVRANGGYMKEIKSF